jgi:hypothetical protein
MFEMQRQENGQTIIYRTDNEGDFIRQILEDWIGDYGLTGRVTSTVQDAGEGWSRVEINFAPDLDPKEWEQIGSDFSAAFSNPGKGWYDSRGQGQNEDGTAVWYVVKHNHGLWI